MTFRILDRNGEFIITEVASRYVDEISADPCIEVDDFAIFAFDYHSALSAAARIEIYSLSHLAPMYIDPIILDFLKTGIIRDSDELYELMPKMDECDFRFLVLELINSYVLGRDIHCMTIFNYSYNLKKTRTSFDLHLEAMAYFRRNLYRLPSIDSFIEESKRLEGNPIQPYYNRIFSSVTGEPAGFPVEPYLE